MKNKIKEFKSSVYCHSDCGLWKVDGCCAWITYKKKDVKTASGYENIKSNKEFFEICCYECEFYIPKSKRRLEILCEHKQKYIKEKERMESLIEGCNKSILYNGGGEYKESKT